MPRKARDPFLENYYYHIYNRGNNKRCIFLDEQDKNYFFSKFIEIFDIKSIEVISFCIMNNHFHLLIHILNEVDISKLIHRLCTSYALYFNKKYNNVGHLFQNRYKSKMVNTLQGVINVQKYIEENPVKEGYCDKPENYMWLLTRGTVPARDSPRAKPTTQPA